MHTDILKYKELKAVRCLEPVHEAQLLNYLKATTIEVGLLMNFGNEPTFKRFVYDKQQQQSV
jgi:GxxExxY protein